MDAGSHGTLHSTETPSPHFRHGAYCRHPLPLVDSLND